MTNLEQALGKAVYDAIREKADKMNFIDRAVLLAALQNKTPFERVPKAQQKLFLDVGMQVLKALQAASGASNV